MGEALGNSCDNFSTHDCVASAVSIAASLITEPPGRFKLQKKTKATPARRDEAEPAATDSKTSATAPTKPETKEPAGRRR